MVERRLSQAESGQLFGLCRDLLGAGSPREPQRDRDSATGATARPAEGQRSTNQVFFVSLVDGSITAIPMCLRCCCYGEDI